MKIYRIIVSGKAVLRTDLNLMKNKGNKMKSKTKGKTDKRSRVNTFDTYRMLHAPDGEGSSWLRMLPVFMFICSILLVRLVLISRDISSFEWLQPNVDDEGRMYDFFAYIKAEAILLSAGIAVLMLVGRALTGSFIMRRSAVYVPMAVYVVFTLISYAASDHKDFAWMGYMERYEGTIVILAYLVMLFFVMNTIDSERDVKRLSVIYAAVLCILSALGISQMTGHDFFRTSLGKALIVPASSKELRDSVSFTFNHNEAYQTVYNTNYVSFYMTLAIPFAAMLFIYLWDRTVGVTFGKNKDDASSKEDKEKPSTALWTALILSLGLVGILTLNLAGAQAIGGFLGLGVALVAGIILLNKRLIRWWKPVGWIALVIAVVLGSTHSLWLDQVFTVADSVSTHKMTEDANTAQDTSDDAVSDTSTAADTSDPSTTDTSAAPSDLSTVSDASDTSATHALTADSKKPYIDYIETGDDTLKLGINGNDLTFAFGEVDSEMGNFNSYTITDKDGNVLDLKRVDGDGNAAGDVVSGADVKATEDITLKVDADKIDTGDAERDEAVKKALKNANTWYAIDDERFYEYMKFSFMKDQYGIMYFNIDTNGQEWNFMTMGGVYYNNQFDVGVSLSKVKAVGFKDNLDFGSGRGYIWSRSIPMLGETWFKGFGADMYAFNFPQDDYAGKYNSSSYTNQLQIVVDKPHNIYIGMWIGTGGISCLMFILIVLMYLVQTVIVMKGRTYSRMSEYINAGIFIGVIGFMISGLVNDSTVSVMPMFYTLLGTGFAVNFMLGRQQKKQA